MQIEKVGGQRVQNARYENEKESVDYQKILHEKIQEISEKIKNGDTEPSYQIGNQSFTEKEWDKLIEAFDEVQDEIREQAEDEAIENNTAKSPIPPGF
ncbi:MAG: hypothetical protein K2G89_06380 [Lachnospiraceae bacterium]|nr:hypothetical protein [Lachnospiraceae bacterium]